MRLFDSSFRIGTTLATEQSGLHMSVSPDDGNGARMSYLRFEDQPDGVHVFFDDVTNPGPIGHESTFNETDIATLSRTTAHSIEFSIKFKPGPHNDTVKIYIDGTKTDHRHTWEDYYRYDAEQIGNGNVVSPISKMLFRESGTANPANAGQRLPGRRLVGVLAVQHGQRWHADRLSAGPQHALSTDASDREAPSRGGASRVPSSGDCGLGLAAGKDFFHPFEPAGCLHPLEDRPRLFEQRRRLLRATCLHKPAAVVEENRSEPSGLAEVARCCKSHRVLLGGGLVLSFPGSRVGLDSRMEELDRASSSPGWNRFEQRHDRKREAGIL